MKLKAANGSLRAALIVAPRSRKSAFIVLDGKWTRIPSRSYKVRFLSRSPHVPRCPSSSCTALPGCGHCRRGASAETLDHRERYFSIQLDRRSADLARWLARRLCARYGRRQEDRIRHFDLERRHEGRRAAAPH